MSHGGAGPHRAEAETEEGEGVSLTYTISVGDDGRMVAVMERTMEDGIRTRREWQVDKFEIAVSDEDEDVLCVMSPTEVALVAWQDLGPVRSIFDGGMRINLYVGEDVRPAGMSR